MAEKNEAKKTEIVFGPNDTDEEVKRTALEEGKRQQEKTGFAVPTEFVPIPSKGLLYPPTSSIFNSEDIEIRHMTAGEEDILSSRSLIRSGKAVDMVLRNCLVDKTIRVDDLIAGDKNAIMIALRVNAYGADYIVSVACPSCGEEKKEHIFDLSSLSMKPLGSKPNKEGENRFKFNTPSGIDLEFKILNSGEVKEIGESSVNVKREFGQQVDKNITATLKRQIISVNGDSSRDLINSYVDSMTARDSRALRKHIEEIEPDIIMLQEYECPYCGERNKVDIPITAQFFWPD